MLELQGETALNIKAGLEFTESTEKNLKFVLYRAWLRIANPQNELRIGLQRLSFGSAKILRPLQWFDKLNPLDKSEFTNGVWAALAKRTWMNNSNLWLWGILGDDDLKGIESYYGKKNSLEFGGRMQFSNPIGETSLAYHQRKLSDGDEFRIGFDHRYDGLVGAWIEGSGSMFVFPAVSRLESNEIYQTAITFGFDYSLPVGNGLSIIAENMLSQTIDDEPDWSKLNDNRLAIMLSYPLGLLDTLSLLNIYGFKSEKDNLAIIWRRTYDYLSWDLGLALDSGYGETMSHSPTLTLKINYNL